MCHVKQLDPGATDANLQKWASPDPDAPIGSSGGVGPAPDAVTKDTKFGKLLKVITPIVQGGAIGATANPRQPGAGSEAAGEFFNQRAHLALLKQNQQRLAAQQASQEALRQSTERRNDFYDKYLQSRTEHEQYLEAHPKPEPDRVTELAHYPGIGMHTQGSTAGTTVQLKRPAGPDYSDVTANGNKTDLPLGPPQDELDKQKKMADAEHKDTKPHWVPVTDSDEKGVSTTGFVDQNPDSPTYQQREKGVGSRRFPKPTKGEDKGQVETWAQAVADRAKLLKVDPEEIINEAIPEQHRAAVRQRIREQNRPMSPKKGLSPDLLKKMAAGVPATP